MAIIATGVVVLVVVIFGRALARFYIDALWFDGLGQSGVFWGTIRAKLSLFGMFFVAFSLLAGTSLWVADRLAPTRFPANVHPVVQRFHDTFGRRLRLYRYAGAAAFAFLMALPTTTQWQTWMLFRNRRSFGTPDAQFGVDVGFYVFELPFLSFVLDWLFFAMVIVLMLTVITHLLNGGVVFASPIPTVNTGTRGHVAVLLAVLAALKAADYWIRRYETTNERRGFVQGATYSVVNALHPALLLLAFVAIVTAGLYLSSLRTHSWRLPLVASALWMVLALVAGVIYPAAVQGLVVNPNQQSRESAYISRNIAATRAAMGITDTDVTVDSIEFGSLSAADIAGDLQPLVDVRLLNPTEMRSRFQIDQGDVGGLTIADLDVDRYVDEEGNSRQMLVAARELDLGNIGNRTWQGRHLINTRGCGLTMAPASRVLDNGRPDYQAVALDRPELYFSPILDGYAIAGTAEDERTCGDDDPYAGTAGVAMSSFLRRAAFGLAFLDYSIVGSGAIDRDSQMLWVRNVRDRLEKVAPFLSYDGDPYPVEVGGRVLWVTDAYTSTSRYPYAQAVGNDVTLTEGTGIPRDANYVRNSVKAVVDAYDGSVTLYVVDDDDPVVDAWWGAFPDLFAAGEEMPEELRAHLRYPEDLFRVQSNVYSKYQARYQSDPAAFFEREGAWSVAQAPNVAPRGESTAATATADPAGAEEAGEPPSDLAEDSSSNRFIPYYSLFTNGDRREFVLLRPFVPFSRDDQRTELQAFMTASSDPETYGQLTVYEVDGDLPDGPLSVANAAETETAISTEITLLNQDGGGSNVRFGDLQLVPIAGGLVYVRPFYVASRQDDASSTSATEYRYIIVSYNGDAAMAQSLAGALNELFPDLEVNNFDRANEAIPAEADVSDEGGLGIGDDAGVGDPSAVDGDPSTTDGDPSMTDATVDELLAEADELLRDAEEQLLVDGNLGDYQERVDRAQARVAQALELLGADPAPVGSAPTDSGPADSVPTESVPAGSAPP